MANNNFTSIPQWRIAPLLLALPAATAAVCLYFDLHLWWFTLACSTAAVLLALLLDWREAPTWWAAGAAIGLAVTPLLWLISLTGLRWPGWDVGVVAGAIAVGALVAGIVGPLLND